MSCIVPFEDAEILLLAIAAIFIVARVKSFFDSVKRDSRRVTQRMDYLDNNNHMTCDHGHSFLQGRYSFDGCPICASRKTSGYRCPFEGSIVGALMGKDTRKDR